MEPKAGKSTLQPSRLFWKQINEKGYRNWAESFGPEVAEVLASADDGEWGDQNPSRDVYCRFGWRTQMPASQIAGWWQWSIKEFERELKTGAVSKTTRSTIEAYSKAFGELLAVL
jgi:hypothetical protein